MDYSLAALKVMCRQLKCAKAAEEADSPSSSFSLGGVLFQRVWVQGILVSSDPHDPTLFLLDDSTSTVHLSIHPDFFKRSWTPGMYVLVVGSFSYPDPAANLPVIKAHKIVDLTAYPDREAMWYLEVIEAYKMFYRPLAEESD